MFKTKIIILFLISIVLFFNTTSVWAGIKEDEHIRQIVQSMLKEKDKKIQQLEARVLQLEKDRDQLMTVSNPKTKSGNVEPDNDTEPLMPHPQQSETDVNAKLNTLDKKIQAIKASANENGLDISGFFDINAKTSNSTDQTFSIGLLELDIAYNYNEHFAASSALVLCGNSPGADYETTPAHISCGNSSLIGAGSGSAAIAVGLIDFHMFDSTIPPRGRIFNNQGFHFQAGRFDLPFSADYQYFANKDRISITSPITTVRIQKGGFNGDGVRSYGSWGQFNYSAFWTNGVYENSGTTIGGRLGMTLGQNSFRIHGHNMEGVEFGVSHLSELDGSNDIRNTVYAADLSLGYDIFRLQNELLLLQGHQDLSATYDADGHELIYGKNHQLSYHSTLTADLESIIKQPLAVFARYGRWQPNQRYAVDGYDGSVVAINSVSQLSLGLNYKFSEHLRLKFEYSDSLGTQTQEHYFDKKLGMAQLIVAF